MSKLDDYITKLMLDDDELKHFLADPICAAEDVNGLSKAQRSVLRRVVANLSNNATNGYSLVRNLTSYRRSIRLLQNVLHVEKGSGMVVEGDVNNTFRNFTIYVYYTGDPSNPKVSLSNVGAEYAYYMTFTASGNFASDPTIKQVMELATDVYGNPLKKLINVQSGGFDAALIVNDITVPNQYFGSGVYVAPPPPPPITPSSQTPFWFYSVGGKALVSGSGYGYYSYNPYAYIPGAVSFAKATVPMDGSSNTTIFWQVIAPDQGYNFAPCYPTTVENMLQ